MAGYGLSTPYGSISSTSTAAAGVGSALGAMSPMGMIPSLTGGAGGAAGPSTASQYNPISFTDGSFIVSGSPSLGTSVAGAVAGATNSYAGIGMLQNVMPYVAIAAVVYLIATRRKRGD